MTFVLVHGAFHGGWCWQRVARLLSAAGHAVNTPTQTGLGERSMPARLKRLVFLDAGIPEPHVTGGHGLGAAAPDAAPAEHLPDRGQPEEPAG